MASLAKRLPVGLRPEQRHVALVRNDVVNDRTSGDSASPLAIDAQGIGSQVDEARFLPCVVVTTLVGSAFACSPRSDGGNPGTLCGNAIAQGL